jgi:hypothetical protein
MLTNRYAEAYSRHLRPFLGNTNLTLAEFGILKGTGLAIWCDLFPDSHIIGLDIDLSHFYGNQAELLGRGAFRRNEPRVCEYDQLVDGRERLAGLLKGRTLDIVIDDGLHSLDSIVTTWRSVKTHLSPRFVYFVEDYSNLSSACMDQFAPYDCYSNGMLTVISAGVRA